MFEKIIFSVLALAFFTITFLKLIKKNDTSYIYILALEFIGMFISFIGLFFGLELNRFIKILTYIFCIIIPVLILWVEKSKKIDFPELFNTTIVIILNSIKQQDKAKEVISNFLNKNPNSYLGHKLLAEIYEKEENYEASISEYMKVTDLKRNDLDSTYKLCEVLNKNKQSQESIELLEEILKQKPNHEKASNLLGTVLFEQERYKEAISVYMTALRYHSASYDLYYNLGMTYTMINDFQRAKEFYEKAAEINSLAYNTKLNLGQIALIYGDLEEAEKYFMQSSSQDNLEAGSYYYLAQIALLKGDEDKAKNYMNVAVELDSKVYNQVQKDPIFTPIKEEIKPPDDEKIQTNYKNVLSKKERKVNNHLMRTCILVKNLKKENVEIDDISKQNLIEQKEKQKE